MRYACIASIAILSITTCMVSGCRDAGEPENLPDASNTVENARQQIPDAEEPAPVLPPSVGMRPPAAAARPAMPPFDLQSIEVPAAYGPLRFAKTETKGKPAYQITSADDDTMDFSMPESLIKGLLADTRMSEDQKVKAIVSFGEFQRTMPTPPPANPAIDHSQRKTETLETSTYGTITISPSPADAQAVHVTTPEGLKSMPARAAYSVLTDPRFDDEQKAKAILSFPFLKPVE